MTAKELDPVDRVFAEIYDERLSRNCTDYYAPWLVSLLDEHKQRLKAAIKAQQPKKQNKKVAVKKAEAWVAHYDRLARDIQPGESAIDMHRHYELMANLAGSAVRIADGATGPADVPPLLAIPAASVRRKLDGKDLALQPFMQSRVAFFDNGFKTEADKFAKNHCWIVRHELLEALTRLNVVIERITQVRDAARGNIESGMAFSGQSDARLSLSNEILGLLLGAETTKEKSEGNSQS